MAAASALRRFRAATVRRDKQHLGVVLTALDPAYRTGRSIFPSRVFDPSEVRRVLKDGHQSRKIGKVVAKGTRRGWPLFTLTLEERATCPETCRAWSFCYGNNMQAAERITAGPALEVALWGELAELQALHPAGFMVRLHVLGDFYSLDYVRLWQRALAEFPALHVFGFTAHDSHGPIGSVLWNMTSDWARFAIRFSGLLAAERASNLLGAGAEGVPCPAQTGATDCCATCGLCWHSQRSITFARH